MRYLDGLLDNGMQMMNAAMDRQRIVVENLSGQGPARNSLRAMEAMLPYLTNQACGNPSSSHRSGRAARAGLEPARRAVAQAIGAEPTQVIFASGGTEADNLGSSGA